MNPNTPSRTRRPAGINKNPPDARTPRAVRFSESEWQQVRTAASKRGISFGSFVREAAMTLASGQSENAYAPLSPGIERLIKQTFRYTFVLASIKRDELVRDQRDQDIDNAIDLARIAQDELLSSH